MMKFCTRKFDSFYNTVSSIIIFEKSTLYKNRIFLLTINAEEILEIYCTEIIGELIFYYYLITGFFRQTLLNKDKFNL